jgi:hypothetical protein
MLLDFFAVNCYALTNSCRHSRADANKKVERKDINEPQKAWTKTSDGSDLYYIYSGHYRITVCVQRTTSD